MAHPHSWKLAIDLRSIFTAVLPLIALVGCGRIGFDPAVSTGGDGGVLDGGGSMIDGAIDAGSIPDGGGDPSCAVVESVGAATCSDGLDNDCDSLFDLADPDCAADMCMVVTTNSDALDGGESLMPPHLGDGLSLREAITLGNSNAGPDCIVFDSAMTITIESSLPRLTGLGGLRIDGAQRVHVQASGVIGVGFAVESENNAILGLRISNVTGVPGSAIEIRNGQTTVGPNVIIENSEIGIIVAGANTTITRSHFHNISVQAIQAKTAGTNLQIRFNVFHDNTEGMQIQNNAGMFVQHNSFVANGRGINFQMSSVDVIMENNLFVGHTDSAIRANGTTFASLDFCGFFDNATDCNGCSLGTNSITTDPLLAAPNSEGFQLSVGSPAIDRGTDTGLSPNGTGASSPFNGTAPDIGAIEFQ